MQKHGRAGDLAPATLNFVARQALRRRPASLHHWRSLPLHERVLLALSYAGTAELDEDYLDFSL